MHHTLSESVIIKTVSEDAKKGVFEIEGLYKGYGITVGNTLRRVLLSSLPGAAATHIKIKGINHEFTTIPNVMEDVVEIALNVKRIRFRSYTAAPHVLHLAAKGETEVTAADIYTDAEIDILNPEAHICTLTAKSAELDMEITVEHGMGYEPIEARKAEKLPVGVVALDAFYSPVIAVNFTVQTMRVGERADYNRVLISIETDSSITPSEALKKALDIMVDHFGKISAPLSVLPVAPLVAAKKMKTKAKKSAKGGSVSGGKEK